MKTYEERRKETTMEPDDRQELLRLATEANDRAQRAIRLMLECGHTHRATEAELRAEIEKLSRVPVMAGVSGVKLVPHAAYLSLRAAFDSIATVIQGAYLNGQLPPISDAELAEKIITEYGRKQASSYEQGKRADAAEKKLRIARDCAKPVRMACGLIGIISPSSSITVKESDALDDIRLQLRIASNTLATLADASPQPESAERKENAGE